MLHQALQIGTATAANVKDFSLGGYIAEAKAPGGHFCVGATVHARYHHFAPEAFRLASVAEDFAEKSHAIPCRL